MKTVNISIITDLLNKAINTNNKLQEKGHRLIAYNLVGEAGIGKTSVVEQLAAKRGMGFTKLNLAQLDEIGDLVGMPIKELEVQAYRVVEENGEKKLVAAGRAWATESMLKNLNPKLYKPTGNSRTSYAKPAWVPEYNENGNILLLDDFTRCTPVFTQAIMELLRDQKYVSWKLPKKTTILLTSNPDNGNYNVSSMDEAQNTRCLSYNIGFDADTWAQWAETYGIDSRCISFALMYGSELFNKDEQGNSIANPRSFSMFCDAISDIKDWNDNDNLDLMALMASGCFNDEDGKFASMFATFIQNKMHLLVSPKDMLNENWAIVMPKIKEQIANNSGVAALLERRFTNYLLAWFGSDEKTPVAKVRDRILDFIHDNIFSEDMFYHMILSIKKKFPMQAGKLLYVPEIAAKIN